MKLQIQTINVADLVPSTYNPRKWSVDATERLTESIREFGLVDPILVNRAPGRENIVIGGHFRLKVAKDLGIKEVPVVYIDIPEVEREKELNLRLNKNLGEWDLDLLKEFDEAILADIGFTSEDLDSVFEVDDTPENFNLKKELEKLDIHTVEVKREMCFN